VQRVHHDLVRAEQLGELAARGQADLVAQREFLLQRAVGGHAVVHPAGKVANLRMQGAAEGHVDLLKAPADAEHGLARVDRRPDQRQRQAVAAMVEGAVRLRLLVAVMLGMDVRPPAGEDEPVAGRQQIGHPRGLRHGGDDQGKPLHHFGHGADVHLAGGLGGVGVVDDMAIAEDADDRTRHECLLEGCDALYLSRARRRVEGLARRKTPLNRAIPPLGPCFFAAQRKDFDARRFPPTAFCARLRTTR
jgi:hypothetical protein